MNILCIDTETTGVDCNTHSLLQIAAEMVVDGKVVDSFNQTIKHDLGTTVVDLGALKVNGVRTSELDSLGQPESTVITSFIDWVSNLNTRYKDILLLGHNVGFDRNFISATLTRHKIVNLDAVLSYRVLDTSTIGLFLVNSGVINLNGEKFGFSSLLKALGIDISKEKIHDAAVDVKLTVQAYFKMFELVKNLPSRFDTLLKHKEDFKTSLDGLMKPPGETI